MSVSVTLLPECLVVLQKSLATIPFKSKDIIEIDFKNFIFYFLFCSILYITNLQLKLANIK